MRLAQARIITKLDIRRAYNLIGMKEDDEWKTIFRTQCGLFELLVMTFGPTKAPVTFQSFINNVLLLYPNNFTTAYLDDILMYSNDL